MVPFGLTVAVPIVGGRVMKGLAFAGVACCPSTLSLPSTWMTTGVLGVVTAASLRASNTGTWGAVTCTVTRAVEGCWGGSETPTVTRAVLERRGNV